VVHFPQVHVLLIVRLDNTLIFKQTYTELVHKQDTVKMSARFAKQKNRYGLQAGSSEKPGLHASHRGRMIDGMRNELDDIILPLKMTEGGAGTRLRFPLSETVQEGGPTEPEVLGIRPRVCSKVITFA
jgi:hypothetical protein